jgi:hypothetical protein
LTLFDRDDIAAEYASVTFSDVESAAVPLPALSPGMACSITAVSRPVSGRLAMQPSVVSVSSRLNWPAGAVPTSARPPSHSAPMTAGVMPSGSRPRGRVRQRALMMDYGGMDAVFNDTFGNLINLHQD